MSDEQSQERAAGDPDAGATPLGFWDDAKLVKPNRGAESLSRLDSDVLSYFRGIGVDVRAGMIAKLRDCVEAHSRVG